MRLRFIRVNASATIAGNCDKRFGPGRSSGTYHALTAVI
jgi:hypothetical protein